MHTHTCRLESAPSGLEAASMQDQLLERQTDMDRTLLKIFHHALKADRQGRAMEAVAALNLHRSLEGERMGLHGAHRLAWEMEQLHGGSGGTQPALQISWCSVFISLIQCIGRSEWLS